MIPGPSGPSPGSRRRLVEAAYRYDVFFAAAAADDGQEIDRP